MVKDALKAYLQLASGLTEVTRERATSAAQALVTHVGSLSRNPKESSAQVRALADELAKTARDNRDLVMGMVRSETERAVAAIGAASTDELAALRRRVDSMQIRLDQLASDNEQAAAPKGAQTNGTPSRPARRTPPPEPTPLTVEKAVAKKRGATKTGANNTGANDTGAQKTSAQKAATKKSTASKTASSAASSAADPALSATPFSSTAPSTS